MIDQDAITAAIDQRKSFKIGARGICATFLWSPFRRRWDIHLPRANAVIHASEIGAVSEVDFYLLEILHDDDLIGDIDLMAYDKLTVIE